MNSKFELSDEIKKIFLDYSWEGNIRELRNYIEYLTCIDGVFILRKRVTYNPKLYHVPFFPVLPLVGFAGGCYLILSTFKDSPKSALLGLPVFHYCKSKNKNNNQDKDTIA